MNSRERVLTAFAHEEPDHVPCWLGASPEFRKLACDHLKLPDDESLSRYLGDDFRRVFSRYAGPPERSPDKLLMPGATWRSPFGVERHGYGYGMPLSHPLKEATLQQIHDYAWPDPDWIDVSHVRADALQYNRQYAILGGEWSPFWHDATDLLDWDVFCYKMFDEPAVVDAVLQHTSDFYWEVSRRIFDVAADALDVFFIGNDFGGQRGPLLSEETFRRFIAPHLKRLVDLGHDYGLKVMMHCCGGYRPLMPALIEMGMDGLQALQPSTTGMDPASLKRDFGDKVLLCGCIDTQHVLIEGTPELARQKTRETLALMKPGGGYVASPSHDYLLPETPVENVIALYETVRECGGYADILSV